jgi:hypothetical protein
MTLSTSSFWAGEASRTQNFARDWLGEDIVFLTQDTEFEDVAMTHPRNEKLFELLETGQIIPWEVREGQ